MQLVQQVKHAMRVGRLGSGDKLPTAKEVVADTAINPNTVFKAYRVLEGEGLVEGRPGVGTFVRESLAQPRTPDTDRLRSELAQWTDRASAAGLGREDIEAVVKTVLDDRYPKDE